MSKINYKGKELSINEARGLFMTQLEQIKAPAEVKELAELVVKKQGGGSGGRRADSKQNVFRQLIIAEKRLSEDKVWATFKWGKHEALSAAWGFRKKGEPKDFLWIKYQKDEKGVGYYVLVGQGPNAPEGFEVKKAAKKEEADAK